MLPSKDKKLDNPVWFSLSESHRSYSVDYEGAKFYHPDYCPFGGIETPKGSAEHLEAYAEMADDFFVVGEQPEFPTQLVLKKALVCLQMVRHAPIDTPITEKIALLGNEHAEALFQLVTLVQPGYFKRKTAALGNYFGIFKDGALVAVSGERMKMDDFVEVSAIVTHPDHTGRGYAKQLIAHTVNRIFQQQKTPYLHVVESNLGAIQLYEKLGFTVRRKINFWHFYK